MNEFPLIENADSKTTEPILIWRNKRQLSMGGLWEWLSTKYNYKSLEGYSFNKTILYLLHTDFILNREKKTNKKWGKEMKSWIICFLCLEDGETECFVLNPVFS